MTDPLKPCPFCGFQPTLDLTYHFPLNPCPVDSREIPSDIWNSAHCWKEIDRLEKENRELKKWKEVFEITHKVNENALSVVELTHQLESERAKVKDLLEVLEIYQKGNFHWVGNKERPGHIDFEQCNCAQYFAQEALNRHKE